LQKSIRAGAHPEGLGLAREIALGRRRASAEDLHPRLLQLPERHHHGPEVRVQRRRLLAEHRLKIDHALRRLLAAAAPLLRELGRTPVRHVRFAGVAERRLLTAPLGLGMFAEALLDVFGNRH
jgi:hypothetical protein